MVYILASKPYGTLYIGVTSNLANRIEAHRSGSVDGFTKQYGVDTWKIRLIEEMNPEWKDLSAQAW